MHTPQTALETLELLWNNYLTLDEQVNLESMPYDKVESLRKQNSSIRPFRLSTWLACQGYYIAAWSLWEYYARSLCKSLSNKATKARKESTVDWVAKSLSANNISFQYYNWFRAANSLRNLIAHNGARVDSSRTEELLKQSRIAFPGIVTLQDGYIDLTHEHVSDLQFNIEEFIRETA